MNNLKFRAWDKKLKLLGNVSYIDFKSKKMIYHNHNGLFNYYVNFEDVEIMQSTGLFDKNGKEFFDGDIVASSGRYYVIQQSITGLWKAVKQEHDETWYLTLCDVCDCFEIAGNIYENKELLG